MKFSVPDTVLTLLDAADVAESKRYKQARIAEEAEAARLQRIEDYRQSRIEDLGVAADTLFAWRDAFLKSGEANRIWRHVGTKVRLELYGAKFWRGEPAPAGDRQTWSVLSLDEWRPGSYGLPCFWYEERCKGNASHEARITNKQALIDAAPPDFLLQAQEHLEGPDAWKFILQILKRRRTE